MVTLLHRTLPVAPGIDTDAPVGIGALVFTTIVVLLLIAFIPKWQMSGRTAWEKQRLTQEDELRRTVAQIIGGLVVLIGLYLNWRENSATLRSLENSAERQVADLLASAVAQLNDSVVGKRVGGVYSLQRLADFSPRDRVPAIDLLVALVTERADSARKLQVDSIRKPPAGKARPSESPGDASDDGPLRQDVQAALTALGRLAAVTGHGPRIQFRSLDLTHLQMDSAASMRRWQVESMTLAHATLSFVDLDSARMDESDLSQADLRGAHLVGASLLYATLDSADLRGADLSGADLVGATLEGAQLQGANLCRVSGIDSLHLNTDNLDTTTTMPSCRKWVGPVGP